MENYINVADIFSKNTKESFNILKQCSVGIAGVGGLGSTIAMSLVRAGVGKLVLVDFDKVELSNLNRQQYTLDQVGLNKVEALKDNLLKINPELTIEIHATKLDKNNIMSCFSDVDLLIEAFDVAEMKAMLIQTWLTLQNNKYIIAGSGLAGYGAFENLKVVKQNRLILCGDHNKDSDPKIKGLMAPRVWLVACMQANEALEILLKKSL